MTLRRRYRFTFALAALAVASGCAPTAPAGSSPASVAAQSKASASPSPSPASSARTAAGSAATAAPNAAPTAAATAAPPAMLPAPTASPAPTATPTPVLLSPNAAPEILDYTINTTTVHPGGTLSGTVWTSSNVASVEVRVANFSVNMHRVAVGEFQVAYVVPNIPPMFRKTYPMTIVARNARGDATQRTTAITIR